MFADSVSAQSWVSCITPTSVHINSLTTWSGKLIIGGFSSQGKYILSYDGLVFDTIGIIDDTHPSVWALQEYNNELYVGGDFESINGIIVNGIAKYDGAAWQSLGTGLGGNFGNFQTEAFAVLNNELFVGGLFDSINGIPAKNIARWNGTSWNSMGVGFNGGVSALGVYQNELYAGGYFFLSGADTVNHVAKWDGIHWQSLLHGIEPGITSWGNTVFAIKEFQNTLYVGGLFAVADTIQSYNIACWNGSNWTAGPANLYGTVTDLSIYNNKLFIGGFFEYSPGNISYATSWDGISLDNLQGGLLGTSGLKEVWDIEVYNNRIYYGGNIYSDATMNVVSEGLIAWDEFNSSVNDLDDIEKLKVFPVPVTDKLHFLLDIPSQVIRYSIADRLGRIVLCDEATNQGIIDVTSLDDGFYVLTLINYSGSKSAHFIKNQ